jgi:hypothetical protein
MDGRADQYALALLAYEMLTGERRVSGVIGARDGPLIVSEVDLRAGRALRPGLASSVNSAIRRALMPNPDARYASAGAFAAALAAAFAEPDDHPAPLPETETERRPGTWRQAPRAPYARVLPAVGFVTIAVAGAVFAQRLARSPAGSALTSLGVQARPRIEPQISGSAVDSVALAEAKAATPPVEAPRRDTRARPEPDARPPVAGARGGSAVGTPQATRGSGAGQAFLDVSAPGAVNVAVLIDGTPVGPPPLRMPIAPGVHVVSLSRGSSARTLVLRAGDTTSVRLDAP